MQGVSRRHFLGLGVAAAGAAVVTALPDSAGASVPRRRVLVLGGGVGGLTAAHELAERGYRVTVVEPKAFGGKARSIPVPGTGTGRRRDLPGEHGFRFFPGFYKNVPDTMRRIPVRGNANGVFDHLVNATQEVFTMPGGGQLWMTPRPADGQDALIEGMNSLVTAMGVAAKVPPNEVAYFARKMAVFLTSSDARRVGEWEYVPWTTFTNSKHFSPEYQAVFGTGLTKDLVAAKGAKASTRTVGLMGEAFVYAIMAQNNPAIRAESGYGAADRLLDAPTNEAWIDPWVAHLQALGVRLVSGYRVARLDASGGRISSVVLRPTDRNADPSPGSPVVLDADWYVCAMPAERMAALLNRDVLTADPRLTGIGRLQTDWMNGIQYFLNRKVPVPIRGHVAYLDTPWALTSIEQGLFWRQPIASRYGDGRVHDIWSVDISDWATPGIVHRKPAAQCTPDEIAREVWAQMKRSLNTKRQTILSDDMVVRWALDPAIHYPQGSGRPAANREPLLINTVGSLDDRPDAATAIPNLFLAADYVRTNVDLATMEGANEAGRLAANAILAASGSSAKPASLGTLWQPRELDAVRRADEQLYRAGQPNALDVLPPNSPI